MKNLMRWLMRMFQNDSIDMQARLIKAKHENAQLRAVLNDLLIKQGMATPAWEPVREVLGLPSAMHGKGRV